MSKNLSNKKAQVTVFIIIGIILLIVAGLYFLLRPQLIGLDADIRDVSAVVPREYQPIKAFLDTCLREEAVNALRLLGEQGGYIYPDENGVEPGDVPTTGNGVEFMEGSGIIVPYWYYLDSPNECESDCEFVLSIPYLRKTDGSPSIEEELERYVDRNIRTCLNDFNSFRLQGYKITEISQPTTTVRIGENSRAVNFLLQYEIDAEKQGTKSVNIKGSYIMVPLNLEKIYNTAVKITALDREYRYIDNHIKNLVYGFSSIDSDRLPPPSDSDFNPGGGTSWAKKWVEEQIKGIMQSYMLGLQVIGARNFEYRPADTENQEAYWNRGMNVILDEDDPDYYDYDITFQYIGAPLGWEMYFNINCGNTCEAQSASSNIAAMIGLQRYKFFYDISMPVAVTIDSPDELVNELEGYKFQFFIEANLRDNEMMRPDYERLTGVSMDHGTYDICDADKRNSGDIAITLTDSVTGEPVPDVSVMYNCIEEVCVIGKTDENGELTTRFPTCVGGIVNFVKNGYEQTSIPMSIKLDQAKTIRQAVNPLKEIKVVVMKKKLVKIGGIWRYSNTMLPLLDSEDAMVTLEKVTEPTELEFSTMVVYTPGEENTILVAPGKYDLKINIFDRDGITIPAETREYGPSWDRTTITLDEIQMDYFPSGGADIRVEIGPGELRNQEIIFYAVGVLAEDIKNHDDKKVFGEYGEISKANQERLKPDYN